MYVPITGESDLTWTITDPATANALKLRKFDYTLVKSKMSWSSAKDACTQAAQQAQLAKLDSKLKNDLAMEKLRAIKEATTYFGAWFGASRDPNAINNWIFTDGSAMDFNSWSPGRGKLSINMKIHNIELKHETSPFPFPGSLHIYE